MGPLKKKGCQWAGKWHGPVEVVASRPYPPCSPLMDPSLLIGVCDWWLFPSFDWWTSPRILCLPCRRLIDMCWDCERWLFPMEGLPFWVSQLEGFYERGVIGG